MANFDPVWFGYAALLSLLATGFAVRVEQVRLGIAVAALLALPVAVFGWHSLGAPVLLVAILILNPVLAARVWYRDPGIRFTAEELALRSLPFPARRPARPPRRPHQGPGLSAQN